LYFIFAGRLLCHRNPSCHLKHGADTLGIICHIIVQLEVEVEAVVLEEASMAALLCPCILHPISFGT